MAIDIVSSQFANGDTLTMPTHAAGDLILGFANRAGSTAAPSLPAGWASNSAAGVGSGGDSVYVIVASKYAESSGETFGTWTNATQVGVLVLRSDAGKLVYPNAYTALTQNNTTTINYPALAATGPLAGFAARFLGLIGALQHDSNANTAPTGMTNVGSVAGASSSSGMLAIHATASASASWSQAGHTSDIAIRSRTHTIGLTESLTVMSTGGGGIARLINNGLIG